MVDFVEEVEEQLRAERYAGLARRLLPWFAAAVAATVVGWLGVWAYDSWTDRNIAKASLDYDKGVAAASSGDNAAAFADFAAAAKDGAPGYRTLALLQQGNVRFAENRTTEAVGLYDSAAKSAPNAILGDLARLRAAQASMDTAPYSQTETRLKSLIGDKKPYALQARELLAMAKLQAGRIQEARGDFNAINLTLGVSPAMRARVQGAIALIDSGQAGLVGQVVKAASALPAGSALDPALLGAVAGGAAPDSGSGSPAEGGQADSGNAQ